MPAVTCLVGPVTAARCWQLPEQTPAADDSCLSLSITGSVYRREEVAAGHGGLEMVEQDAGSL